VKQRAPEFGAAKVLRLAARLAALLAASLGVAPLPAGENAAAERAEHELTRSQATALVQQRYGARVVRAGSSEEGGRHIYVFRLLSPAGKVWEVHIDARSGAEVH
jgi:hypothetical protein